MVVEKVVEKDNIFLKRTKKTIFMVAPNMERLVEYYGIYNDDKRFTC